MGFQKVCLYRAIFLLKLKSILTKINFHVLNLKCQKTRPIHPLWHKLERFHIWVTPKYKVLIINDFAEATLNMTFSFRSFIVSCIKLFRDSLWHRTHYLFSDVDAAMASFQVLVNTYFLKFRLALLWFCMLIELSALVHLI